MVSPGSTVRALLVLTLLVVGLAPSAAALHACEGGGVNSPFCWGDGFGPDAVEDTRDDVTDRAEPVLDEVDDALAPLADEANRQCRERFRDEGAAPLLDAPRDGVRIPADGTRYVGALGTCRDGSTITADLTPVDEVDRYRFRVEKDVPLVVGHLGSSGCRVYVPGPGFSRCAGLSIPARDGVAFVTIWSIEDAYMGVPAPQRYAFTVATLTGTGGAWQVEVDAGLTDSALDASEPVRIDASGTAGRSARVDTVASSDGVASTTSRQDTPFWFATAPVVAMLAWVLYRRITADDALDNDIRSAIVETVREEPGIHATELARRLDVTLQTVCYHARVLDETGHLERRREGRKVVFFVPGEHEPVDKDLLYVLSQDGKRELVRLLSREPGLAIAEAARRLDRCRSTVKHHVDDLVDKGVVETRRDGLARRLALVPDVRERLDAIPETP